MIGQGSFLGNPVRGRIGLQLRKYTLPGPKERSHTLIICWTALALITPHIRCGEMAFDKILQCHKIYFHPVLH